VKKTTNKISPTSDPKIQSYADQQLVNPAVGSPWEGRYRANERKF
jgi:hypothetical protein